MCNQKTSLAAAFVFSLVLAACGGNSGDAVCGNNVCDSSETAASCFDDCGCGNGVQNPGEACDGQDFGGATCMSETQHGGTLKCNADCTFDVDRCTLASCGNGIVEDGEACDGSDLGGKTCSSIGYAGGQLACNADCAFDSTTCCSDSCPSAGAAECVSNSVRECVAQPAGCLAWQITDCGASNEVCDDSSGTATCTCVDRCDTAGDTRCENGGIETCQDSGGCLDWVQTTDCTATGELCAEIDSGPLCVAASSAEDCAHPYVLHPGQNVVAWSAANADYLTAASCETANALVGPDLVLSYTAPDDGFVRFTLDKPASQREVVVASEATCGMTTPELACVSEFTARAIDEVVPIEMGHTYNFYVRDTDSGSDPLPNPLQVSIDETLCSSTTPHAILMSPRVGALDTTPVLHAVFDLPIDPTQGVITVTGDMGTNLTYDLATAPDAISIINNNKTLVIDPGFVFPSGETVSVTWTGLYDTACAKPVAPPSWSFTVGTSAYEDACVGGTTLPALGTTGSANNDDGLTAPITLPAGFQFFGQPATRVIASTNGWLSVDTTLTSSYLGNATIPSSALPNGLIAPYWNDLDNMVICTKTVGNKLVVQWTGTLFSPGTTPVEFQAILDPTDSSIEFVYGANQGDNSSATVGVENAAGTDGLLYEFNTGGAIIPGSVMRMTTN